MASGRSARRTTGALLGALALAGAALAGGIARGATPVSGFISGQVVSVKAGSFVVKDSFGSVADSTVTVGASSSIIEQLSASRRALTSGACVVANGEKASSGAIDAQRITISAPVKGSCTAASPFGRGRPAGAAGGPPPSPGGGSSASGSPPAHFTGFGGFGGFGFAAGAVGKLAGSTLTVKSSSGSTKVTLSSSTQLLEMHSESARAISAGECVSVRGTSSTDGATVAATSINLSKPGADGCSRGFGRP